MRHWLACTLTRRHDYRVSCADGVIFLLCAKCGRRSSGWQVATPGPEVDRSIERPREARTAPRIQLSPIRGD
jgi:hypothetical protein